MTKDELEDKDGVEVRCVEVPGGLLTVSIRTLTDQDLQRLLRIPRFAPRRAR